MRLKLTAGHMEGWGQNESITTGITMRVDVRVSSVLPVKNREFANMVADAKNVPTFLTLMRIYRIFIFLQARINSKPDKTAAAVVIRAAKILP